MPTGMITFMNSEIQSAYLAAEGFLEPLQKELDGVIAVHGRLILSSQPVKEAYWAQNIWRNLRTLHIDSINDAAKQLKAIQRNWCLYSYHLHRRAKLILEKLPPVKCTPLSFPSPLPTSPLGSFTLLDENTLLASAECSSPFPNGEVRFVEDKDGPPNRAYLKLYEALTLAGTQPQSGEFCIDVGGSPGGWTWVINQCGAEVLSIDRSPLSALVAGLKGVSFQKRDAFTLLPEEFQAQDRRIDWLFSDVICYPEKLYEWIRQWVESGICKNFICTIKFKGGPDLSIVDKFAAIPNSRVLHLFHNKNELTWSKISSLSSSDL
jgi:23S rRNA (cytidine2498-2'-O)-methyltransferase